MSASEFAEQFNELYHIQNEDKKISIQRIDDLCAYLVNNNISIISTIQRQYVYTMALKFISYASYKEDITIRFTVNPEDLLVINEMISHVIDGTYYVKNTLK
jgi:hypothetical protein